MFRLFCTLWLFFCTVLTVYAVDAAPAAQTPFNNISMWQVVTGTLLPLLIAWANRLPVPNYLIAFVLCLAAAFGDVWFSGKWDGANVLQSVLTIFFLVVTTYKAIWQPSGITNKIEGKQ